MSFLSRNGCAPSATFEMTAISSMPWRASGSFLSSFTKTPGVLLARKTTTSLDSCRALKLSSSVTTMASDRNSGVSSAGLDSNGGIPTFALSSLSFFKIQKGDITKWFVNGETDAVVNAANERMLGGGGVDGAIHRTAGPELVAACREVPEVRPGVRCPTGEARITPAFRLPVSHVIHTVGPIYASDPHPETSLRDAYRNSLRLARENNIQYIAFPAISCGVYDYPFREASRIAILTIKEFGADFKEVHFVLFSDDTYNAWLEEANKLL